MMDGRSISKIEKLVFDEYDMMNDLGEEEAGGGRASPYAQSAYIRSYTIEQSTMIDWTLHPVLLVFLPSFGWDFSSVHWVHPLDSNLWSYPNPENSRVTSKESCEFESGNGAMGLRNLMRGGCRSGVEDSAK
jgi:hypothetical protein